MFQIRNVFSMSAQRFHGQICRLCSAHLSTTPPGVETTPIITKQQQEASSSAELSSPLKQLLDDSASFDACKPLSTEQQWATLPYTDATAIRKQGEYFKKPKTDPRDASIILFPGQGSQYLGMVKDLLQFPMARDLFDLANYILGYDLLKLCTLGPKNKLDETRYSQPAIVVASLAALERLKEERPQAIEQCAGTAGFSLGEITALIFAGAIDFEEGIRLVAVRGEAMQMASDALPGAMVTVFYGPDTNLNTALAKAREWAAKCGVSAPECRVANYLYPHCKIVAGCEEAITFLEKNMAELKLRRLKRLPVSGAFHTELMRPAVEPFRRALDKVNVEEPNITVYSCVDGRPYRNVQHIRKQLPKQMVRPVKWEQLLHLVYERDADSHFPRTFECGPGSGLKAILKQVNAKAWDSCFSITA